MTTTEQRLTAEREAEIRDWNATCRAQHIFIYTDQCVSDVLAELDAVRRERDEARKDSARLEWWEKHADVYKTRDDETSDAILSEVTGSWNDPQWRCLARARSLRAAIDAAMAKDGDQ